MISLAFGGKGVFGAWGLGASSATDSTQLCSARCGVAHRHNSAQDVEIALFGMVWSCGRMPYGLVGTGLAGSRCGRISVRAMAHILVSTHCEA
jgi:hypothetical protein